MIGLESACAIITGGGTGIGLAIAKKLHGLGARLFLLGRRGDVVEQAARKLDPEGARVFATACDIRDGDAVDVAVKAARQCFGQPVSVLVNNAGGQFPSPAVDISPKGFEAVVRNNLFGTWNITRAVAQDSLLSHGGVILNVIANMARGFPGMAHTGAARAGVENLTRTLAIEWVSHGVRVNAVAPGYIASEAMSRYPEELAQQARRATPMKRLGTVEEVANAVVFLVSPEASFITGQTLYVDGGASLWGDMWAISDPNDQSGQNGETDAER